MPDPSHRLSPAFRAGAFHPNGKWVGIGFALMLASSFGQTFFIGLSGEALRFQFGLSDTLFGTLYMLATLASALSLPWLGRLLDVMPSWRITAVSLGALMSACVMLPLAHNWLWLVLALYLLRLFGQGMMTEIAFTETGRRFTSYRGRAIAVVSQGVQLGAALLPPLFIFIASESGDWRMGWLMAALVILLLGLPSIICMRSASPAIGNMGEANQSAASSRDWTRTDVLRDPAFYLLLSGALAPAFIGTVLFFHQGALIEQRGYDPMVFAASYPVMAGCTVIFGLLCGYLIDRFGALKLLPLLLIPLTLACGLLGFVSSVWAVFVFMALFGISNGLTGTLLGALWPEVYGSAHLGAIRGIIVAAMVLATALGPPLSGLWIEAGASLPLQLLWLAGWCIIATVLLIIAGLWVRHRNRVTKSQSTQTERG